MITLTASENYMSRPARLSGTMAAGSYYHFPPPYDTSDGEWLFPSSGVMQKFVLLLANVADTLFETKVFDWRPNGGSISEVGVMLGVCRNKNDAIIHFGHSDGGHFAIEPFAARMGIQVFHLPVNQRTLLIDVERLETMLKEHPQIKLVMLDQSFKLREQPLRQIKSILPENVPLCYDCSHDSALIAGGKIKQPLTNGADLLIGNTHKTTPGPQKAFVGYAKKDNMFLKSISEAIVETLQSNCHAECLLPMLIAFKEMEFFSVPYAEQIVRNAKTFAKALKSEGFNISGESFDFTETHQVHLIWGNLQKSTDAVNQLHQAGIRTNNIEIPGSNGAYGLRLGVQAMTRCGMKENDFEELARLMSMLLLEKKEVNKVRSTVDAFDASFSRFPLEYSFDKYMGEDFVNDFITEIVK
ncbi:serine hydroxymethyltransferase [Bacteroidia bacterium]|nr:serine hydroxymethyltransferase [Bacteroidia bacterium]